MHHANTSTLGRRKKKEYTNQRVNSICRHACIKTRLLLGFAKTKESMTERISSMCREYIQQTGLLLDVAKYKESTTQGPNVMDGHMSRRGVPRQHLLLGPTKNATRTVWHTWAHTHSDTTHTTHHTEHAHRSTGATWPKTPQTPHNTGTPVNRSQTPNTKHRAPSAHTGEQEPIGPGHRTHCTTHHKSTPENRSQKAQDTTHKTPHTERAHQ